MESAEKLIAELKKHSICTQGIESTNKDNLKYRYDLYTLKYKQSSYWLTLLFYKAQKEVTGKDFNSHFFYKDYSIRFDRATFKGQPDGKINFTELILL